MSDEIRICKDHQEYETPVIWTFAFNGSEYWCPYCGANGGMLGFGVNVPNTEELERRHAQYKMMYGEFLHATGVLICVSTEYKGVRMTYEELPEEEKDRLAEVRSKWKPYTKAEGQTTDI